MFSTENWKVKLAYAGFGSLFTTAGFLLSTLSTVTADEATDKVAQFDTIECREIQFVDGDGKRRSFVTLGNKDENEIIMWNNVTVYGNIHAAIGSKVICSRLEIDEKQVILDSDEEGGRIVVKGNKSSAVIGIAEHGGFIGVTNKDGNPSAEIGIDEYGGVIHTFGRSKGKAIMGILSNGDGFVGALDKNGYSK